MTRQVGQDGPAFGGFRDVKRRAVRLSQEVLVRTSYLDPEVKFPLVVTPNVEGVNLPAWAEANRAYVDEQLLAHGALLFRDFNVGRPEEFQGSARALSPELLDYLERAAPRTEVGRRVYTSTEYPADQRIPHASRDVLLAQLADEDSGSTATSRPRSAARRPSPTTASVFDLIAARDQRTSSCARR